MRTRSLVVLLVVALFAPLRSATAQAVAPIGLRASTVQFAAVAALQP